ncbi:MAG TPA: SdpI family protein [Petrotogaceae bacterium]|nr:SdpI family protein [Petrotogaceae bacterium]HNV04670.1 SdpI family protein [Petrotogaceae bacterium]HNY38615.1 SdpI family protein [Petrotogaceae bacterium]HOG34006.1 SdpI family protein [Petrotogaceae bacterium]HPA92450.1 SdpI family protein [Petrotogaceae bacterium]
MLIISLIFTVLISLTMIGFGYMLSKKTPKGINSLIGYRSPMSTKNLDTWKFANEYSGRFWIKSGFITAAVSIILAFALQPISIYQKLMFAMIYVQIAVLLLVIPFTEIALRKKFYKTGEKKSDNDY